MAICRARTRSRLPTLLVSPGLLAASLGLATVSLTPVARADAVDSQFLKALQGQGINFGSPQAAIQAAHQVCDELDSGRQKSDVANEVAGSSNLDGYHAGYFVGVSVAAYCPRHHSTN
ncbi:MAG: DUF732 domain-containing protein [Mycobacteriaceae bacterium]|nr:DUF732 domain-containing protein [Mycobacteriaceae bacterium]